MQQGKQQSALRGQTSLAKKVYEAVPIEDYWQPEQIHNELIREGKNISRSAVIACLHTLAEAKLIRQKGTQFQRAAVKSSTIKVVNVKESEEQKTYSIKPASSPTDKLAIFSNKIRAQAATLNLLADEIDDAVLEVEGLMQATGARNEKVLQLQALLAELTSGTVGG